MCKNNACGCNGSGDGLMAAVCVVIVAAVIASSLVLIAEIVTAILVGALVVLGLSVAAFAVIWYRENAWKRPFRRQAVRAAIPRVRHAVTAGARRLDGRQRAAIAPHRAIPATEVHLITDAKLPASQRIRGAG